MTWFSLTLSLSFSFSFPSINAFLSRTHTYPYPRPHTHTQTNAHTHIYIHTNLPFTLLQIDTVIPDTLSWDLLHRYCLTLPILVAEEEEERECDCGEEGVHVCEPIGTGEDAVEGRDSHESGRCNRESCHMC